MTWQPCFAVQVLPMQYDMAALLNSTSANIAIRLSCFALQVLALQNGSFGLH